MAERVACEAPEGTFSAVGIYAGSKSARSAPCTPPRPLPYLHLHGTNDIEVKFSGSPRGPWPQYVGAEAALRLWASIDQCAASGRSEANRVFPDLNSTAVTTVRVVSYGEGCAATPVEGWWVDGWGHVPPDGPVTLDIFVAVIEALMEATRPR